MRHLQVQARHRVLNLFETTLTLVGAPNTIETDHHQHEEAKVPAPLNHHPHIAIHSVLGIIEAKTIRVELVL